MTSTRVWVPICVGLLALVVIFEFCLVDRLRANAIGFVPSPPGDLFLAQMKRLQETVKHISDQQGRLQETVKHISDHQGMLILAHKAQGQAGGAQEPGKQKAERKTLDEEEKQSNGSQRTPAFLENLNITDRLETLRAWDQLTKVIAENEWMRTPPAGIVRNGYATVQRMGLNFWSQDIGKQLEKAGLRSLKCAEIGDGFWIKHFFKKICTEQLFIDLYDKRAHVAMDLELAPELAPKSIQDVLGTFDVVIAHNTLEHLQRPATGIANFNALLKVSGRLIVSTPFLGIYDHNSGDTKDMFRYTVRAMDTLVKCAGFEVKKLEGLGNAITGIAYIATLGGKSLPERDVKAKCDGMKRFCKGEAYYAVAAIGVKQQMKTPSEIHKCIF